MVQERVKFESSWLFEHPRIVFFFGCIGYLAGAFLGKDNGIFPLLLLIGLTSIWVLLIFGRSLVALFFYGFICVGGIYGSIHFSDHQEREIFLKNISGNYTKNLFLTGMIVDSCRVSDRYCLYRLRIDTIDNVSPPTSTNISLKVPKNLIIKKGDILYWKGKLSPITSRGYDSYVYFSYIQKVYARASLFGFGRIPTQERLTTLELIRSLFLKQIEKIYPPKTSGLLSGMLIGDTEGIDTVTSNSFRLSGLSHLLAVSGSNVALLLIIVEKIVRYFRPKRIIRIGIVGSILLFFMFLVGLDVPVVRATIMGTLIYLGFSFDSKIESLSVLGAIMVGFVISDPLRVIYDTGLMLSCLATLSIIIWKDAIGRFYKWIPVGIIKDSAAISTAALAGTSLYSLWLFGNIPLLGIITNILAGPVVGLIMFFGLLSISISYVSVFLGHVVGYIVYGLVEYLRGLSSFMSSLDPGVHIDPDLEKYIWCLLVGFFMYMIFEAFVFIGLRTYQNQKAYLP